MSVRDVTNLRKEGKLKEAFELAKKEMNEDSNEWTNMSMFWVLRDYVQNVFLPAKNMEQAKLFLAEMASLLPIMIDDSGAGQRAYQTLYRLILPNADLIKSATELSKTDPTTAYKNVLEKFGAKANGVDAALHEDYGWIIYRYVKYNANTLQPAQIQSLLQDYLGLQNERPSMLHSTMLNYALNYTKEHRDFNIYDFVIVWGLDKFRDDDYYDGWYEGNRVPSLIEKVCRAIIESGKVFDIETFVEQLGARKNDVIEHLRQAYFWKLINLQKENKEEQLWNAFDYYAKNYSALGPSHWHSEILNIANRIMDGDNSYRFLPFIMQWNINGNLREEDWQKEKDSEGNVYPSLALKTSKKCFEIVKSNPQIRNDSNIILWLKSLYSDVITHNAEDDWSTRNYATICLWGGLDGEAVEVYKKLLSKMGDKYYLWSELASCIDNNRLRIGLLLKAKSLEKNEDFLGDIHLSLAKCWEDESYYAIASQELAFYSKHREEKGWSFSNTYKELSDKLKSNNINSQNPNFIEYIQDAEDFVYSDFDWHNYVLTDKWVHDGKEYCNFVDGESQSFSVKTKRFPILKKAKPGTIFNIKCRIDDVKQEINTIFFEEKHKTSHRNITPLTMRISDAEPWSIFPIKYGIVEYVNEEKHILHILTQESKLAFGAINTRTIPPDSFVKFKEYDVKQDNETKTYAVGVVQCSREEALPNMRCRIVVVDDVNENKQLFHIVLGRNLVSDIVRFDQTDIRPSIGDFLQISYCVRKNKKGEKRIKILDIKKSDKECEGVTKTISGRLLVKYKDLYEDTQPNFAFIEDNYVHKNVLNAHNITEDCNVIAKLVLGGDNKWKVYDLEVVDQ